MNSLGLATKGLLGSGTKRTLSIVTIGLLQSLVVVQPGEYRVAQDSLTIALTEAAPLILLHEIPPMLIYNSTALIDLAEEPIDIGLTEETVTIEYEMSEPILLTFTEEIIEI